MELFTLGIDLGKTTFHLVGMNQRGEVVLRKRFSRVQLLQFTANLRVKLIGMEACGNEVPEKLGFREVHPGGLGPALTTSESARSSRQWSGTPIR